MPTIHNRRPLKALRRGLRSSLTPAEATLWRVLQRSHVEGRKFRRQQSIGPYIVDFYCPSENLVVELEGAAHDSDHASKRDGARESFLRSLGLKVLRLENHHVFENLDGVVALIRQHFRKTPA
ncbi:MAG: DUF559 domain-containing protein [Betaproteobacteria bacterium]|nr:DUF559 domain-containing protein [Betaproteobacteria bacterium]